MTCRGVLTGTVITGDGWPVPHAVVLVIDSTGAQGFAKIHGWFRTFSGTLTVADPLEHSSVDVLIDAASIDTGNADRDAHLRSPDFLDVAAFPQIRYTGQRLTVVRQDTWRLDGRLTLKSVTQPVALNIKLSGYRCRSAGRRLRWLPCQQRARPRSVRHHLEPVTARRSHRCRPHAAHHHRRRSFVAAVMRMRFCCYDPPAVAEFDTKLSRSRPSSPGVELGAHRVGAAGRTRAG